MNFTTITEFALLSTLFIGAINLLIPFIGKGDNAARNFLFIINGACFLISVLILDWLFLEGARLDFELVTFASYSIKLQLEGLGLVFLSLLASLWGLALVYSSKYLAANNLEKLPRFLFFVNLSMLAGVMVALSANLFTMFIFYEILTLATIPLISHSSSPQVSKGLSRYLKILMGSSMALFLPAIMIIYHKIGNFDFAYKGFIEESFSRNEAIILLLMFIFGVSKTAIYPMHKWLPAAMVAPYPVSALLHAVLVVKTGLFCILKIIIAVFGLKYLQSLFAEFNWVVLLAIFSIFYSGVKALNSNTIKTILAYSTINQLSIVLASAFMFTPKSIIAASLHMVSHSFAKICLFFAAGSFYSLRSSYKVSDLAGIAKIMPKTSLIFLLASLSLIGIPPLGGFVSKFYILLAAIDQNNIPVIISLVLATVLSGLYLSKFIVIFTGRLREGIDLEIDTENENSRPALKLMVIVAAICLLGTICFIVIQKFISQLLSYL